jgi:hypothetical protein
MDRRLALSLAIAILLSIWLVSATGISCSVAGAAHRVLSFKLVFICITAYYSLALLGKLDYSIRWFCILAAQALNFPEQKQNLGIPVRALIAITPTNGMTGGL